MPDFTEADMPHEERVHERINATKRLSSSPSSPSGEVPHIPLPSDFLLSDEQPKIDSAATSHVVYSEKFLDDYVPLNPPIVMGWGESDCVVKAVGRGILLIQSYLPHGTTCKVFFSWSNSCARVEDQS